MERIRRRKQTKENEQVIANQKDVFKLIKSISGQSNIISIPAAFVNYTNSLQTGLFLSQLLYWTDKTKDGWIYKTYSDWKNEIYLSEYEVRKAKNLLEKRGIIETKIKKANGNPTLHYRLKIDNFSDSFLKFLRNGTVNFKEPIINTEITTEITNNITLSKDKVYIFSKYEECIFKIINFWNNLPRTQTHSRTDTKIYKTISLQIENLLCGKPLIRKKDNSPTKYFLEFLSSNHIPSSLHTKSWEEDEIKDILQTIHDEHSASAEKLSLPSILWNQFAKRGNKGFSLFLHTAAQIDIPQEYIQLASKLAASINAKLTPSNKKQWAQEFQRFIEKNNISVNEVNSLIEWYRQNQGGRYIPVVDNVQEFQEKYFKLIQARNRNHSSPENSDPIKLSSGGFPLITRSYDRKSKKRKNLQEWQELLESYTNKLLNADIWKQNHTPDKITVFNGVVSMQVWLDNLDYFADGGTPASAGSLKFRIYPLDKLIDRCILYITEGWEWMDGIKDNVFDVNNKIFQMVIREIEESFAVHIAIKSEGWINNSDWEPRN